MGIIGILLYWMTSFFISKDKLPLKSEINATNKKLVASFKYVSLKTIIRNNSDIKKNILKLFYVSFWINTIACALIILFNVFYTTFFIFQFANYQVENLILSWNWTITLIGNILLILFFARALSDIFKLSLRGQYRCYYLKLFFIDLITLNLFSTVGTYLFSNYKKIKLDSTDFKTEINFKNYDIKKYFRLIFKIEIISLLIFTSLFLIFLVLAHYVNSNAFKLVSLSIVLINMILIYAWSLPRIFGILILQKMIKKFILSDSYYYFLTIIRFLVYIFGYYYFSVLINILKLNENTKVFVLENW